MLLIQLITVPTYTALQRHFVYFKELDHQMNWTLVDMYG